MSVQRVTATVDASGAAERLQRVSRAISPVLYGEMATDLGRHLAEIYRTVAPHRSGRLARNIRSVVVGGTDPGLTVQSTVANPKTGFHYTRITRFGHRVSRIFPRQDRASASVIATRKERGTGGQAALRFTIGGRVLYRRSVKGYRPSRDWAGSGHQGAGAELSAAAYRVGRRLIEA